MEMAGSTTEQTKPLWLLAELTYACPLQCPYCSNPLDFALRKTELTTEEWKRVFAEARQMGSVQLGLSGGEPLVRQDLEELVAHAHELGFYSNLITSAVGMDEERLKALKKAGLDTVQVSFQAASQALSDSIAGTKAFDHKVAMAKAVKQNEMPLILNFVLDRFNIDSLVQILDLTVELEANYVELANTQYYGFALHNRDQLLPTEKQVRRAEDIAHQYQKKYEGKMKIYYVIPDYYENRPKPCMNSWGNIFMTITPDGTVLPCHTARSLPNLNPPSVREHPLEWIWNSSPLFNRYRGFEWMKEPCRSCPEKFKDFGGCRCQAFLLTGDAETADPVCDLSPYHHVVLDAVASAKANEAEASISKLVYRNPKNSKLLSIPIKLEK